MHPIIWTQKVTDLQTFNWNNNNSTEHVINTTFMIFVWLNNAYLRVDLDNEWP